MHLLQVYVYSLSQNHLDFSKFNTLVYWARYICFFICNTSQIHCSRSYRNKHIFLNASDAKALYKKDKQRFSIIRLHSPTDKIQKQWMHLFIFFLIHIYFVTILAQPESLNPRPRDHDFHHVVREVHRYHNHALSLSLIVKKGKQNEIKM